MITTLISAVGYLGSFDLIKKLKEEGFRVIGTDANPNTAAKFYCDEFYETPPGNIENQYFLPRITDICQKEKVDVILPASSAEIEQYAFFGWSITEKSGAKIMVSHSDVIRTAIDKGATYNRLRGTIRLPQSIVSHSGVCCKPLIGKGARGIHYLPDTFVMEKLEGEEIDVDVIALNGEVLLAQCKTRERTYGGTLIEGEVVERPEIVDQVKKIIKIIPVDYLSVIQFKGGKLLEVNPRMAGAIIDQNIPVMAIKLFLNQITPDEIRNYQQSIGKRIARTTFNYVY
jgi:carbamoyl-phosphate synthase large subunit